VYDQEGDDFGIDIDLRRARNFANYTYNWHTKEIMFFFKPELDDPPLDYPIDIRIFNKTDESVILKK
jgi:hypothetical protein